MNHGLGIGSSSTSSSICAPSRESLVNISIFSGAYLPPGSLYSFICLLYSWGSLSGVPIRTFLDLGIRYKEGFAFLWMSCRHVRDHLMQGIDLCSGRRVHRDRQG